MENSIRVAGMGTCLLMGGVAFFVVLLLGRPYIALLKKYRIGKQIRIDGPSSHMVKTGTPTMGGGLFVSAALVLVFGMYLISRLLARITPNFGGVVLIGKSLAIPMMVMLGFAIMGAIDDYMGVRGVRRGEGMRGRSKFAIQVVIATIAAVVMNLGFDISRVGIPFVATPLDLGLLWIPVAIFIILASANGVNFTDGLDGLAALISFLIFIAYGIIAYLQGQVFLTMLCMVMAGALAGFLWFNVHPAGVFMGDLGSEALGATLGVIALMTGQWLVFPLIAIIPAAEVISVVIQVLWFKYTKRKYGEGKRFFKMAPIHNHFVQLGWSEPQIVQRFWLIGIIGAMVGIGLAVF